MARGSEAIPAIAEAVPAVLGTTADALLAVLASGLARQEFVHAAVDVVIAHARVVPRTRGPTA